MRRTVVVVGALFAIVFGAATAVGFATDPVRTSFSYLFAYGYVFTTVTGALFLLLIGHATNARWFVAVRRSAEHVVGALPALVILFVPVAVSVRPLYPWTHPRNLSSAARELVLRKGAWLSEPFFLVRAAAYLALLAALGEALRSLSLAQDRHPERADRLRRAMVGVSSPALVLVTFAVTFAGFDWFMSLEPTWYSNVYGVYLFAGGFVAALGAFGALVTMAKHRGTLPPGVGPEHFHAVGRLELAMVVFWAYIAWVQLVLIWIADLPLEVPWYLVRLAHGWQWVGATLLVLHFFAPFLFLLFREPKRRASTFALVSVYLVAVHALDVYYLVVPAIETERVGFRLVDVFALFAVSGACIAFGALRARGVLAYPACDPLLAESCRYEAA